MEKSTSGIIHDINNEIPKISDGIILPILRLINKFFFICYFIFFIYKFFFQ